MDEGKLDRLIGAALQAVEYAHISISGPVHDLCMYLSGINELAVQGELERAGVALEKMREDRDAALQREQKLEKELDAHRVGFREQEEELFQRGRRIDALEREIADSDAHRDGLRQGLEERRKMCDELERQLAEAEKGQPRGYVLLTIEDFERRIGAAGE